MNPNINIHLFQDWAILLRGKLIEMGYTLPAATPDDRACIYYYDIVDRTPSAIARQIHKADSFTCPSEHLVGLSQLEDKLKKGHDIRSHLSLSILNPDNFDGLLLDWGIHHLHLGKVPHVKSADFVARTGPLLYARFTSTEVYFIGIMEHGKWSDLDLIRILHRNWPSTMEPFRIKGVVGLSSKPSESDIGILRQKHINSLLEIEPGVIYGHLGTGINSAGNSTTSALKVNRLRHFFESAEKMIDRKYEDWKRLGVNPNAGYDFKLEISQGSLYAYSEAQRFAIKIKE